jgi:diacylglycerol kinase family enzyme
MNKVLLVSNPYAGSVSPRTREVIVKALAADFSLEVTETVSRDHATELSRDAADRSFDAVLVFGGDGTINEAAQGIVGTELALGILPGGSTNVMARALGVPRSPVEATAFLAHRLLSGTRRRVNVGRLGSRYFFFSAGMGLDAEVVRRVEADPKGKGQNHERLFVRNALIAGMTQYRGLDPLISVEVPPEPVHDVVTAICCNASPFTYYHGFPVDLCPEARLDKGLDVFGLGRLRLTTTPRLIYSLLVSRSHTTWRSSLYRHDISAVKLSARRRIPVQIDGDYIGDHEQARIELVPRALDLLV